MRRSTRRPATADVVAVVRALGYTQVNLYGLLYGARLALTVIRDFGQTGLVRSAVLGGVYGPEANALQVPVGLAERLEQLFATCAADPSCNAQYDDLRRTLRDLLAMRADRSLLLEGLPARGDPG